MAQSSKQTCIILRIVRILSPTNNSALHQEKEGVKCMWLVRVHVCLCACVCVCVYVCHLICVTIVYLHAFLPALN